MCSAGLSDWAQVVGSVLAILVAGMFPKWHYDARQEARVSLYSRLVERSLGRMIHVRRLIAGEIQRDCGGEIGIEIAEGRNWLETYLQTFDSIRPLDLPSGDLLGPIERCRNACSGACDALRRYEGLMSGDADIRGPNVLEDLARESAAEGATKLLAHYIRLTQMDLAKIEAVRWSFVTGPRRMYVRKTQVQVNDEQDPLG